MLRYAITDRARFPGDEAARKAALLLLQVKRWSEQVKPWSEQAHGSIHTGLDMVQLREKDLEAAALADLARQLLTIFRAPTHNSELTTHNCLPKLLINSRADVAVAVGADGVHLTSAPGSLTPAQIRQIYSAANLPAPVVSVSCHTVAEVAHAAASPEEQRPTMILFGPVFEKRVGDRIISEGTSLDLLQQACLAADSIPVLALGGITLENTQACLTAGAAGIAAIRLFAELR